MEDKTLEDYIPTKSEIETREITRMVIAKFIPSMKQLFRTLRKKGHFIDSTDKNLKGMIRKAYQLKAEGFSESERFVYFGLNSIENRLSTLERKMVNSTTKGFGLGVVVEELGKDPGGTEWVRVHFNGRKIPTLVNKTKESFSLTDGTSGKVTFL